MGKDIQQYNAEQVGDEQAICDILCREISTYLSEAESKVWHGHPVWFIEGNPVAGYSKRKIGVALLFWSGQSFDEPSLTAVGSFRAAEIKYTSPDQIDIESLKMWLDKSTEIQWDYKNIVKKRGVLERLK